MSETIKIRFYRLHHASQKLGTSDDHLVSRIYMDIFVGDKKFPSDFADIKQTVGSRGHDALLEVGRPFHYNGPLDYAQFQEAVVSYYRSLIGPEGSAVKIDESSTASFRDCTFEGEKTVEIEIPSASVGW